MQRWLSAHMLCAWFWPRALIISLHVPEAGAWIQNVSGQCSQRGSCVESTNYPRRYGNKESCTIVVDEASAAPISAVRFRTEKNYDILTVNGLYYSGRYSKGPEDVVPTGVITWSSDDAASNGGWKLCLASERQNMRDMEPPIDATGLEMFTYAFMTVMIVWVCPLLFGFPTFVTSMLILLACRWGSFKETAYRIAIFPYIVLGKAGISDGDSDYNDESLPLIFGWCCLFWGLTSLVVILAVILVCAAIVLAITYTLGLVSMLLVIVLVKVMERVAKTGLRQTTNLADTNEVQAAGNQAEDVTSIWSHPAVKFTYRFIFFFGFAFFIALAVFFQFLVDAMLIEGGLAMLPSSGSGSETPPVYQVAKDAKDTFFAMGIVFPFFELFRPTLKWFHSFLDWSLACSPASWAVYSTLCVSATFIGFLWCTTDIAAALYDRQKRLEEAQVVDEAGTLGYLQSKVCGLVVQVILKVNFYALQMVAQSILSGFSPMMSHSSKSCEINVEHPKGIELGYHFAWLLGRVVSYYALYVMASAFYFVISGVHYDLGWFVLMARLSRKSLQDVAGTSGLISELHKVVSKTLPIFLQGILFLTKLGRETRNRAMDEVKEDETLSGLPDDTVKEVREYFDDDDGMKGDWGFSWERLRVSISVIPATVGVHSDSWGNQAFLLRLRCLVWTPNGKHSAQPENVQLATGKVLALTMSAFPAVGVAYAKLLEYNNESSAWLWTEHRDLQSRLTVYFGAAKEGEEYPLQRCCTYWKFQEYLKWVYRFILSLLVVTAAVRPSHRTFVFVFTLILVLQFIDAAFQMYNKHCEDKRLAQIHPEISRPKSP